MALREICFFYLARQVHQEFPDRRTSGAKLGAHRRRLQTLEPGDVYASVYTRLEQLDQAYTVFAGLYDRRLSANDEEWLEQLELGQCVAPPRHVVVHIARIARQHLRTQLEHSLADFLVPWMADQTQGLLELPSVCILLPLLGEHGRKQFQLWYHSFEASR